MRVNIQYSVELDDLPNELETLVESTVTDRLRGAVARTGALDFDDRVDHTTAEIDSIRKLLYEVDERLSDVDGLLKAWAVQQAAVVQQETAQAASNTVTQPEPATAEPEVTPAGTPVAASEETMSMVRASLTAHKRETDSLRRTMNLGFDPLVPDLDIGSAGGGDEG
jgi:hypothetical protein